MAEIPQDILNRILTNIDPSYDTSEGSFFYDLNSPMAIELSTAYDLADSIITRRDIATSTGDDLKELCAEEGVDKELATYSTGSVTLKGNTGAVANAGDLVSSGLVNFSIDQTVTIPENGQITVGVTSTVAGTIGNVPVGAINSFPKTLTGITSVTNTAPTTGGYDDESDDSLRERYYIKVRTPGTSGNPGDYIQWARSVQGVGSAKVFDTWNGNGSVKVVITDVNKRGASQDLITQTYNYIESVRPIGVTVTVVSATENPLNITANITLANDGSTIDSITTKFIDSLTEYLKTTVFNTTYISIAQIGSLLLDTGIMDYTDLLVNGASDPLHLTAEEIAVVGTVVLS